MFPASAKHDKRARRRLQPALLAGAAMLALALALPAAAQDGAPIRGAVDENAINDDLLDRTPLIGRGSPIPQRPAPGADQQQAPPPYLPATPSDAEDLAERPAPPGRSLFVEPPPLDEDIFEDRPLPIEPLTPTARRRAENQRIGAPNQPDQDAEEPTGAARAARAREVAGGADADEEALDVLATGTIRTGPIDAEIDRRLDPGVEPVAAIEDLDRAPDLDPYAPLGLRLGSFIVRPSVETGLTATSNANSSPDGGSAILSESTLRITAASDWATNSATLDAFGNFRESISGEDVSETFAGVTGTTSVDIGNDLRLNAAVAYTMRPETAASPNAIEDVATQPIEQALVGDLGVEKALGKARFGIAGHVDREWFGDAELASGTTISQADRDNTLATVNLRAGYEISPALTPFTELALGRREYDEPTDQSGFERSADHLGIRAGLEFDRGDKFAGTVALGWLQETPDDETLPEISVPSVDAAIRWSPVRGTDVRLDGLTTIEGATDPGETGSVLYAGRLAVERQMRANLTGNVALGIGYRDYVGEVGHDVIFTAEAGATYWLNRYLGLVGRLRHESQTSSLPDRDYTTNSVFLGLRAQR